MRILGLIPARGGSKSIKRKNIVSLRGRPLLAYTCESALGAQCLSRVILSTDDEGIAAEGRRFGVEVPFMRPAEFSRDDSPSVDVATHAVGWLREFDDWEPDVLVLLQPTSPMRRAEHIDDAVAKLLADCDADTVVSVTEVPHRFHPYSVMVLDAGVLTDFWTDEVQFDRHRRQNLPTLVARNGPAVLGTRVASLIKYRSFYGARIIAYEMNLVDSLDIDTEEDLRLVEAVLSAVAKENSYDGSVNQ